MLNLGGSQKAICFWPKKGTIQWQKRVQFNTNRKKGYTSRFRATKGHSSETIGCTLFWQSPFIYSKKIKWFYNTQSCHAESRVRGCVNA